MQQRQILGCCREPEEMRAAPAHQHRAEISAVPGGKGCPRDRTAPAVADGDRLGGIAGYRDEMNHILDAEAIYLGLGNRAQAQIAVVQPAVFALTEAQKMDCDLRAFMLLKMRRRCRDDHQRTMQKIPYPFQRQIRTF